MTNKDANAILFGIAQVLDAEGKGAVRLAISALKPWKKLSEEKPKKEGLYHIYRPDTRFDMALRVQKSWWNGTCFNEDPVLPLITHWAEIVGPEEE